MVSHRILTVHFIPRTNDGPLDCSCGSGMLASEYPAHRKLNGLAVAPLRVPDDQKVPVSVWNRVRR